MVSGHSQLVGIDSHAAVMRNDPPAPPMADNRSPNNVRQNTNYVIPETRESAETEQHNNYLLGISQSHDLSKGKKTLNARPEDRAGATGVLTPTSSNAGRNR